jgi:hypothetical protein
MANSSTTFAERKRKGLQPLTAERLRNLLHYDPHTGQFTWLAKARGGVTVGYVTGYRSKRGDIVITVDYVQRKAHRLAWLYMTGEWPKEDIDHKNGNSADNRWVNLREATVSQNLANQRIRSNNTSGFKGVTWDKAKRKWAAQIRVKGRHIHIGRFASAEEAHSAYCDAAKRHFGEFARAA